MPDGWQFVSLTGGNGTVSGEKVRFTISSMNVKETFTATFTDEYVLEGGITVYKKVLVEDIDWEDGEPSFTFTLTETEVPDRWEFVSLTSSTGTVSGDSVTFTINKANAKTEFEATFTNEYNKPGSAIVYKKVLADEIDWDEGEPSFTFTLTGPDGTKTTKTVTITKLYADANTDSSGYVTISAEFPDLEYGSYTLEETKMPEDWEFVSLTCTDGPVSGKKATFTISKANAETAVEATYVNQYNKPGAVTVYKKVLAEQIDWEIGNPSFTFTLTAPDGSTESRTVTFTQDYVDANTDADGYVKLGAAFEELAYGTYTLEETDMPQYWTFVSLAADGGTVSGETATFTISRDNAWNTLEATFEDEYIRNGKITIIKYGPDGKTPLEGVTYVISNEAGETIATETTDEDGRVTFEELPLGTYRICEVSTVSGYSLLAEEITATIPLVLTQEEIDSYEAQGIHVDTTDASVRNGEYYFYELTYEVTDTWGIDLPLTGSTGTMPKMLLVIGFGLIAAALMVMRRKSGKQLIN